MMGHPLEPIFPLRTPQPIKPAIRFREITITEINKKIKRNTYKYDEVGSKKNKLDAASQAPHSVRCLFSTNKTIVSRDFLLVFSS
jgi:hypothetical protein